MLIESKQKYIHKVNYTLPSLTLFKSSLTGGWS